MANDGEIVDIAENWILNLAGETLKSEREILSLYCLVVFALRKGKESEKNVVSSLMLKGNNE